MLDTTTLFIQFRPMIEKAAWKTAWKYNIDVEDARSQAYLIFTEAVNKYDESKASFCTYLYHSLRALGGYGYDEGSHSYKMRAVAKSKRTMPPLRRKMLVDKTCLYEDREYDEEIEVISLYDVFQEAIDRIDSRMELSMDAQTILDFIIGRSWETPGVQRQRQPRYALAEETYHSKYGWAYDRIIDAWDELKYWWRDQTSSPVVRVM